MVALHIVTAVVGFGAVAVTGVLALAAARDPASPAACRYFRPGPNWASYLVLLVPVFGAGLEASSGWADLGAAWPWIALGLWAVAVAAGAVHWPAERRLQSLLAPAIAPQPTSDKTVLGPAAQRSPLPPASDAAGALAGTCRRVVWSSGVMTVCFLAALAVMVVQPR
jgi:hypothetical protein